MLEEFQFRLNTNSCASEVFRLTVSLLNTVKFLNEAMTPETAFAKLYSLDTFINSNARVLSYFNGKISTETYPKE